MALQLNPRMQAALAVAAVLREGITLDAALGALGASESRATLRSLAYGAIRGYHRYLALWNRLSSKPAKGFDPLVRAVLAVAFFELEDGRSPAYAIVDAAVESVKAGELARAQGLVNALLRRYLRERASLDREVKAKPATCHAAPAWLAERLRADYPSNWPQILAELDRQAPMWLRVDARRSSAEAYVDKLRAAGMGARVEPKVPHAVLLAEPCEVTALPGFAEGEVSVQDLAAQLVAFPLDLKPGLRVLDACAAPGGKTALMAEREPTLKITAVDAEASRLARVADTLQRCRFEAALVHADLAAPGWWDGTPFERVLLDAPCSALGVIRRHPDIKVRKGGAELGRLPPLQGTLLKAAWSMLARGGRLVYATCTITRTENRDVIARFLDATPDAELIDPAAWPGWPALGQSDGVGRQILPGESEADGFYYAAINKT